MRKKRIILWGIAALLCLSGCGCAVNDGTDAEGSAEDVSVSLPIEEYDSAADETSNLQSELNSVDIGIEYDVGGLPMTLYYNAEDENSGGSITIEYDDAITTVTDYVEWIGDCYFYLRSDNITYLTIDGCWSNDCHVTYPVMLTGGQVYVGAPVDGEVVGLAENGNLLVEQVVNILGTYRGWTEYEMDSSELVAVDYLYEFTDEERELVLISDVAGYTDVEEAVVFESGEVVYPYACNTETQQFYVKTDDGESVFLAYDYDEENALVSINGIAESQLFETLPYAG